MRHSVAANRIHAGFLWPRGVPDGVGAAEAYCLAMTKVYTFGPTFRAQNSNTSRQLAEFWMIEPEIAFADLSDNAAVAEGLLKYTFAALLNERQEDLAFFDQRIEKGLIAKLEGIVGSEFVHMDHGEAIEVLERANEKFEFPVKWGIDLQSEHERYPTEKYAKKPVIAMNYPKDIKAFYMRLNDDGRTVAAMDVRLRLGTPEAEVTDEVPVGRDIKNFGHPRGIKDGNPAEANPLRTDS
jgi:aspartyl/asparaginyl-tRNA synthetase